MKKQKSTNPKNQKQALHRLPKIESVGNPRPLYGDVEGSLFDIPGYRGLNRKGKNFVPVEGKELIPLPGGSSLYSLPDRKPVLWKKGEIEILPHPLTAVGAVLPEGYIFTGLPAFEKDEESKEALPPLPYAALACWQNKNWVAASKLAERKSENLTQILMVSPNEKIQSAAQMNPIEEIPETPWELVIFFCPGVSDLQEEMKSWKTFLEKNPPASIRLKNLACDWELFLEELPEISDKTMGLAVFINELKAAVPLAKIDQLSPYWRDEKEG